MQIRASLVRHAFIAAAAAIGVAGLGTTARADFAYGYAEQTVSAHALRVANHPFLLEMLQVLVGAWPRVSLGKATRLAADLGKRDAPATCFAPPAPS